MLPTVAQSYQIYPSYSRLQELFPRQAPKPFTIAALYNYCTNQVWNSEMPAASNISAGILTDAISTHSLSVNLQQQLSPWQLPPYRRSVCHPLCHLLTSPSLASLWFAVHRCGGVSLLYDWLLCHGPGGQEEDVCPSSAAQWDCLHAYHCGAKCTYSVCVCVCTCVHFCVCVFSYRIQCDKQQIPQRLTKAQ